MWLVKFQLGTQYFRAFILRLINLECCSCASYLRIWSKGLCYKIQLQIWMNILSDKFPCRNRMFTHEWLGETVKYVYTGAHHCQRFSISMWKKVFKIPLTKLTTHLFSHVEFEAEITTPRHFNPYYRPPSWIQAHFTPSTTFDFNFLQTSLFKCLSIEHPLRALSCWFYT